MRAIQRHQTADVALLKKVGLWPPVAGGSGTNGGGHTYGPELWPQPTFAASTGLTLTHSSIAGGQWSTDASGVLARASVTTPPTITAGDVYLYSITIAINQEDSVQIVIGNTANSAPFTGTGTFTGTITIGASPTQVMRLEEGNNNGVEGVTALSIKKQLT